MRYTVYILFSPSANRHYIGQTNDIETRLSRHNSGREKATAPYIPWVLKWSTTKETRSDAMLLERKLKNLSAFRIESFIKKYS